MYKLKLTTLALASAFIFAGCSSVQTNPKKVQLAQADKKDMVCRKMERVGSHFKSKRCITKAQDAEERRSARADLEQAFRDSGRGYGPKTK